MRRPDMLANGAGILSEVEFVPKQSRKPQDEIQPCLGVRQPGIIIQNTIQFGHIRKYLRNIDLNCPTITVSNSYVSTIIQPVSKKPATSPPRLSDSVLLSPCLSRCLSSPVCVCVCVCVCVVAVSYFSPVVLYVWVGPMQRVTR